MTSPIHLSDAPLDVIMVLLGHMDLNQRCNCALVCSEWAKAAAATTHNITRQGIQDLGSLQQWLEKNGSQVETLQLHVSGSMAGLPCAQLQELLLQGLAEPFHCSNLTLDSRAWSDIAAATKLTSVSLMWLFTKSEQADVVSALTALPDLQQLTWHAVVCGHQRQLSDARLLQQLTKLTSLDLQSVTAEALQHLDSLTKLQHLSVWYCYHQPHVKYPELKQLHGPTSLVLHFGDGSFPANLDSMTALQQLELAGATTAELNGLSVLTALTKLRVAQLSSSPVPLQLPALQYLHITDRNDGIAHVMQTSYLAGCTQLKQLLLRGYQLATGPGSLVASRMLQELEIHLCSLGFDEFGPAAVSPWGMLFPGEGELQHLTSLVLDTSFPDLNQADIERLVASCSGLRMLELDVAFDVPSMETVRVSALSGLSHLVTLKLATMAANDQLCNSLAQLKGLRELLVFRPSYLSTVGLRHLAGLKQLTSLGFRYAFDSCKVESMVQEQLSDKLEGCCHAIVNKAPAGSPSDVSARLLLACDMVPSGGQLE